MNHAQQPLRWSASGFGAIPRDVLNVALGSLAIALLAQLAVPIGPVPVTGQTLGVLAVAITLGGRRATLAVLLYIAYGASGLPVFAGGAAGFGVLVGPTAGYLLGFVPAALIMGTLAEKASGSGMLSRVAILTLGTAVIYGVGSLWLAQFVGWGRTAQIGVLPFLMGDALKIAIVALAASSRAGVRR